MISPRKITCSATGEFHDQRASEGRNFFRGGRFGTFRGNLDRLNGSGAPAEFTTGQDGDVEGFSANLSTNIGIWG